MEKKEYAINILAKQFGVKPFSKEELEYFRAVLFSSTHDKDNCTAALYNRYMEDYLNMNFKHDTRTAQQQEIDRCISYLESYGYEIKKK